MNKLPWTQKIGDRLVTCQHASERRGAAPSYAVKCVVVTDEQFEVEFEETVSSFAAAQGLYGTICNRAVEREKKDEAERRKIEAKEIQASNEAMAGNHVLFGRF